MTWAWCVVYVNRKLSMCEEGLGEERAMPTAYMH